MRKLCCGAALILFSAIVGPAAATDDGDVVADTTAQFNLTEKEAEQKLAQSSFFSSLRPYAFGAKVATIEDIKASQNIINMGPGDPNENYDIIIQPGHYGRTTGRTGTTGKDVSEQQLVAYIAAKVAEYLQKQKVKSSSFLLTILKNQA